MASLQALFSQSELHSNNVGRSSLRPRWIFGIAVTFFLLIGIISQTLPHTNKGVSVQAVERSNQHSVSNPAKAGLHLLIPATSSNSEFCKLLLSTTILGYPTPILINYGAKEAADPYKQHLAKVETLLHYLNRLKPISNDDIVLILDGYDVWFQLRPDVLIKRYFEMNRAADERAVQAYGQAAFEAHDLRQTVVFGPDKICWPVDFSRPACWAVPHVPLDQYAWGPNPNDLRESHNEPRWLNSGTIMGPIQDLKDMFQATLDLIHNNYTTDSDQFYFANVFGDQEYARLTLNQTLLEAQKRERYGSEFKAKTEPPRQIPSIRPGSKVEYHIGIDYMSAMFQTIAYYKQFVAWIRPSNSWHTDQYNHLDLAGTKYGFDVPEDIAASTGPFAALQDSSSPSNNTVHYPQSWNDVDLCVNTVTQVAPVTLHFTGEKALRQIWWDKIWFYRDAKKLRKASLALPIGPLNEVPIAGKIWWNIEAEDPEAGRGGAWGDNGGWHSWTSLCKVHEDEVFPKGAVSQAVSVASTFS